MTNQKNNDQDNDKDKKPLSPKDERTKPGENKPTERPSTSQHQNR